MFAAINEMLLDMLAAMARKDYEDLRHRQAQGFEKAVEVGKHRGKQEDTERNGRIAQRLAEGASWSKIAEIELCSRDTIARVARRMKEAITHG